MYKGSTSGRPFGTRGTRHAEAGTTVGEIFERGMGSAPWGPKGSGNLNDPSALRNGSLELLSPDRSAVLGVVNFQGLGVAKVSPERTAAADAIRKVKVELYAGSVTIDAKSFA